MSQLPRQSMAQLSPDHKWLEMNGQRITWQHSQIRLAPNNEAVWDIDRSQWSLCPNEPWREGQPIISPDGVWLRTWDAHGPKWVPYGRWQSYTMVHIHPQTGQITVYSGQTSGDDAPEENVRDRYLRHIYRDNKRPRKVVLSPEGGWQPAVLDEFSNNEEWIDARERQLVKFYARLGMRDELNQKSPRGDPNIATVVFGDIPTEGVHKILSEPALTAATTIGWTIFEKDNPQGKKFIGVDRVADTAALNLVRIDRKFAEEGKSTVTGWKPAVELAFGRDKDALWGYAEILAQKFQNEGALAEDSWRLQASSKIRKARIAAGHLRMISSEPEAANH